MTASITLAVGGFCFVLFLLYWCFHQSAVCGLFFSTWLERGVPGEALLVPVSQGLCFCQCLASESGSSRQAEAVAVAPSGGTIPNMR